MLGGQIGEQIRPKKSRCRLDRERNNLTTLTTKSNRRFAGVCQRFVGVCKCFIAFYWHQWLVFKVSLPFWLFLGCCFFS